MTSRIKNRKTKNRKTKNRKTKNRKTRRNMSKRGGLYSNETTSQAQSNWIQDKEVII